MRRVVRKRSKLSRFVTFESRLGQLDARIFFTLSIQNSRIADARNEAGTGFFYHRIDRSIARFVVPDSHLDLDEFVMLKCLIQFSGQPGGNPAITDVDDRLEVVREAAQVFFLFFI